MANEAMRPKYGGWLIFKLRQPFNVARAYDEAQGIDTPRIWTAERDPAMWVALQGSGAFCSARRCLRRGRLA